MKNIFILSVIISISSFAQGQETSPFIAHEWGTFTTLQRSNGTRLSGLQKDEEGLPAFVQNISLSYTNFKGWNIGTSFNDVTVKMETPVLYFYSDKARDITVDVHFKQGSISQWYPERSDGESRDFQYTLDLSAPKTGWIKWNARVLSADDSTLTPNDLCLSDTASHPNWETPQWIRPRATNSNLIEGSNGEIEKFLFYRGIANFDVPVKVEFNTAGNLLITNNSPENLSYVMVYDKEERQPATIWWAGAIKGKFIKMVKHPGKNTKVVDADKEMSNFEDNLVSAGLFRDEAKAMLNTWKESYFQHDGFKVFWIVNRSFTDSILPVSINPIPDKLERVMVGRSEILTPAFEKKIISESNNDFMNLYTDRFYNAYCEVRNNPGSDSLATLNKDSSLVIGEIPHPNYIAVYPNPAKQQLTIKGTNPLGEVEVIDLLGKTVIVKPTLDTITTIDVGWLTNGVYFILVRSAGLNQVKKFVKE